MARKNENRLEGDGRKMYRFMVAPSPFQVSVVAPGENEALTGLLENFHEVAVGAFGKALEADKLDVTILRGACPRGCAPLPFVEPICVPRLM